MANRKITQLSSLTALTPTDILVVVSDGVTKQSNIQALTDGITGIIGNGTFVTGTTFSGATLVLERNDNVTLTATFTGNTSGDCINNLFIENLYGCSPIILHNDFTPNIDNTVDLGSPIKRFRDVNTVSGTSSIWTSTTRVETPEVHLGLDSSGNTRTITANNSILQNDLLNGGIY